MNEKPPVGGLPKAASATTRTREDSSEGGGQWAKVPEWVAYKGLDATAWNILIILAAKAGRDRVAWISNRTIADRLTAEGLPIHRRGVGKAIHRLVKVGVIEEAGKVVVDRERGTWVKRYRIVDAWSDLREGTPRVPSGQQAPDLPDGPPGGASGGADTALSGLPDGPGGRPDGPVGTPDGPLRRRTFSSSVFSPSDISPLSDAQLENEEDLNPNGQPGAKEEPATDVRVIEKIGAIPKPFDPTNPKHRANRCIVCSKFVSWRRTYCSTHGMAEIMPFLEKAAGGEER